MLNILTQDKRFVNNKYRKWYVDIITKRLFNKPIGYSENHHIIPTSIDKNFKNNKTNIVRLTAKEHFICHLLLTKFTEGENKRSMYYALINMSRSSKNHKRKFNSGYYEFIKKYNSKAGIGRKHSDETKRKISESNKGRISPNKGNKFGGARTQEAKDKISKSKKGVKLSDEHKRKLRDIKLGVKRGVYKRHKEYKKEVCIHCGFSSIPSNIKRWHNDNCKLIPFELACHTQRKNNPSEHKHCGRRGCMLHHRLPSHSHRELCSTCNLLGDNPCQSQHLQQSNQGDLALAQNHMHGCDRQVQQYFQTLT